MRKGYRGAGITLLTLALLTSSLSPAFAVRTTIPAAADSFVVKARPGASRGGAKTLRVRVDAEQTYVGFNLASLTRAATVVARRVIRKRARLVRTIRTSRFDPASPDPAGITYVPRADRLAIVDSEVDETRRFKRVNYWQLTRRGSVTRTGLSFRWTANKQANREPTGLSYNRKNNTLFVSSDDRYRVAHVGPGRDRRFGTRDDRVLGVIDVNRNTNPKFRKARARVDAEGVEYDPRSGDLFILDAAGPKVWRVDAGDNGTFGNADDRVSYFRIRRYGARNPEGLAYRRARNVLVILDDWSKKIYEVTKRGVLRRTIDLSGLERARHMAGIALAPAWRGSGRRMWVVDRGIDNNAKARENDGKIYELTTR